MNRALLLLTLGSLASPLFADPITVNWTDWLSGNGHTANGSITTPTSTVTVTYNNPQGYAFLQTAGAAETDYFTDQGHIRDVATSPFTGSVVGNIPTRGEMVGLYLAGTQTLTFSETIANPFFSYVSLNGNGYAFDQDFDILSFGHASSPDGPNNNGFWGNGTSYKQVVDLGGGVFEYRLLGTGEPHGTIRFTGAFDTVSWRSLSNEYWNGFTVGIQGTEQEVFGTPDSGSVGALLAAALLPLAIRRRRR